MMGNVSHAAQSVMLTELGGFVVIGILALVTFFMPRWWMVLLTAIAIFPFAIGIITGIMAVVLLCEVPEVKRANSELLLSNSHFKKLRSVIASIVARRMSDQWHEVASVGKSSLRVKLFDNTAVFLMSKRRLTQFTMFNIISNADAGHCVIETDKKGNHTIKQWVVDGKVTNRFGVFGVVLTDHGNAIVLQWIRDSTGILA